MGNNKSRFSRLRLRRSLAFATMAMVVIVVATLRIQQWVLRNRAERLLDDIQQIELRKTSFEDAQKMFGHWSKWGHYGSGCTERYCLFSMRLSDFLDGHPNLFKRASLSSLYSALGGRPTDVYADVLVVGGVVWEKRFGFLTSSRGLTRADAEASTASWLPATDERFALHPDHAIVPLHLAPCVSIRVKFTPYEDPAAVRRLMGFKLSSITHWGFAPEKDDVMPAACAEAREEQHLIAQPTPTGTGQPDSPRYESLEYLGRDAGRIAVVKVISKPSRIGDQWAPWSIQTQLEEPLKRYSLRDVGKIEELHLRCSDVNWVPDTRVGERYLTFTDWMPNSDTVACGGIVPATAENLTAARRGVAQDYKAVFGEPER